MIIDLLFGIVNGVLGFVFSALPTFSLSEWLDAGSEHGITAGRYMSIANTVLPLTELVEIARATYAVVLPAIIGYKIANWIWRHIPNLWGFGPGSG